MLRAALGAPPCTRHVWDSCPLLPFRILGISPWSVPGFASAALLHTPVVASAMMNAGKAPDIGRRVINQITLKMTVSCPLATAPPFGTAGVEGSWVSHDLDGISPVPVAFSLCRTTDSAAVCACIRQETIVHEVGSLPDFFKGNGAFPVVDYSLSGSVGIVIKRLV